MTMNYEQIVGWIMEDVRFECRKPGSIAAGEWEEFSLDGFEDSAIVDLLRKSWPAGWEFRIKPRTVKIGSREVEAPVLEPVEGQQLWYWDTGADEPRDFTYGGKCTAVVDGAAFASAGACMEAQQAIRDYVLEQLK